MDSQKSILSNKTIPDHWSIKPNLSIKTWPNNLSIKSILSNNELNHELELALDMQKMKDSEKFWQAR